MCVNAMNEAYLKQNKLIETFMYGLFHIKSPSGANNIITNLFQICYTGRLCTEMQKISNFIKIQPVIIEILAFGILNFCRKY